MATRVARKPTQALWKLLRDDAFASLRDDMTARMADCSLSLSQGKLRRWKRRWPSHPVSWTG